MILQRAAAQLAIPARHEVVAAAGRAMPRSSRRAAAPQAGAPLATPPHSPSHPPTCRLPSVACRRRLAALLRLRDGAVVLGPDAAARGRAGHAALARPGAQRAQRAGSRAHLCARTDTGAQPRGAGSAAGGCAPACWPTRATPPPTCTQSELHLTATWPPPCSLRRPRACAPTCWPTLATTPPSP